MTDDDDHALLARWRDGDGDAGAALIDRHTPSIWRFFANKVDRDVDELAQSTFVAMVEARDRIDASRSFRAYLLGIARHQLLGYLRRRKVVARGEALEAACIATHFGAHSQVIAGREQRRLLLGALRRLPLPIQMTLELFYWEELGIAEIAQVLDEPEGTIKSRLSRAREQLREAIVASPAPAAVTESTLGALDRWVRSLRDLRR